MFQYARTRSDSDGYILSMALTFVASVVLCQAASGQTGAGLLIEPFPKEQRIDARGAGTYEDAGHVKGTDEGVRLSFYESTGRVRIFPGSLTSPRVGWDFETIDIRGSSFDALPEQLTDVSAGVAFPVAKVDEWIFGLSLGVGYAGASAFGEGDAWYGKATAVAFRQFSDHDALLFVLDYDGNRTFLPDVPLPGIAYTSRLSPTLFYVVGIPLSSITWKPAKQFSLEAGWFAIESFHAAAGYEFTPHWSVFGSLDYRASAFSVDGLAGDDRLIFQQRRAEVGVRFAPRHQRETLAFTAAAGYAWAQEFSVGFDSRKTDEVADISDEPYVRVGFEVKF